MESNAKTGKSIAGRYLAREIEPLVKGHVLTLQVGEGPQVDIADTSIEQCPADDARLDPQSATYENGFPTVRRLFGFLDKYVRTRMPNENNAYDAIVQLTASSIGSTTGIGSYVGDVFDFGYSAFRYLDNKFVANPTEQEKNDSMFLFKNCEGLTDMHKMSIQIGVKEEDGKHLLVLKHQQPYGPMMKSGLKCTEPIFVHTADLNVTMTIDLDQPKPEPGQPPKYTLDCKFEKHEPDEVQL